MDQAKTCSVCGKLYLSEAFLQRHFETAHPILEPTQPILEPTQPILESNQPILEPTLPIIESNQPFLEPTQPFLEPSQPFLELSQPILEPTQPLLEPTRIILELSHPILESSAANLTGFVTGERLDHEESSSFSIGTDIRAGTVGTGTVLMICYFELHSTIFLCISFFQKITDFK